MAVTLAHTLESGQSSGTTITTGNSGVGGVAFNATSIGAGAALTYDSTNAPRGSLCMHATTGGTSTTASASWTTAIGTAIAVAHLRMALRPDTVTIAQAICRIRGAGTQTARLALNASGQLELRRSANNVVATSSGSMTTSTVWLIRCTVNVGTTASAVVYIHYDPTVATPDETLTVASADFGTSNVDECNWGIAVAGANVGVRLDDLVLSDVAIPSLPAQSASLSESVTCADTVARALTLPRGVADTVACADTVSRAAALTRALAESLGLADATTRALALPRGTTDTVTFADAVTGDLVNGPAVPGTASLANRTGPNATDANRTGPTAGAAARTAATMTGV